MQCKRINTQFNFSAEYVRLANNARKRHNHTPYIETCQPRYILFILYVFFGQRMRCEANTSSGTRVPGIWDTTRIYKVEGQLFITRFIESIIKMFNSNKKHSLVNQRQYAPNEELFWFWQKKNIDTKTLRIFEERQERTLGPSKCVIRLSTRRTYPKSATDDLQIINSVKIDKLKF